MSISRRSRVTFGLQLARMVAICEAELSEWAVVPTPFIAWALLCLLACRWLVVLVQHFAQLEIGFAARLDASAAAGGCTCK
jgi:hypothetical protein